MPLYEVLEDSYINDRLVRAGSTIDYTPPKGSKHVLAKGTSAAEDTVIGPNLRLAKADADVNEKPAQGASVATF